MSFDVAILAPPFGFGPLGKALAIASALRGIGVSVVLLTDEIGAPVAEAAGFSVGAYEYRQPLALESVGSRVVVSYNDVSTPIRRGDVPLILVDGLYWLRGRWERPLELKADLWLGERFFLPTPKAAEPYIESGRLRIVDVVLGPPASVQDATVTPDGSFLLYTGGMRSPYIGLEYQNKYLGWAGRWTLEAMAQRGEEPERLLVLVPPHLMESEATVQLRASGARIASAVPDFGLLLANADQVIVAPGIGGVLESCAAGKRPLLLPAYNGSHVPQLAGFREARIGRELCVTAGRTLAGEETEFQDLRRLTQFVVEHNLANLFNQRNGEELAAAFTDELAEGKSAEPSYPLGDKGASQVATYVAGMLEKL